MRTMISMLVGILILTSAVGSEFSDRLAALLAKSRTVKGNYEIAALSEEFGQLGTAAFAADDYDTAMKTFQYAITIAKKYREAEMVELWQTWLKRTVTVGRAYKKIEDEPKDSIKRGEFYCFTKEDWQAGLPLLAQGDDDMAKAAKRELEEAVVTGFVELGDMWVEAAGKLPKKRRGPVMRHAGVFYEKAVDALCKQKDGKKALVALERRLAPLAGELQFYARPSITLTRANLAGTYVDSTGRRFTLRNKFAWKRWQWDFYQMVNEKTDYGLEWRLDEETQTVVLRNYLIGMNDLIQWDQDFVVLKVGVKGRKLFLYGATIKARQYIEKGTVRNVSIPLTMTKVK